MSRNLDPKKNSHRNATIAANVALVAAAGGGLAREGTLGVGEETTTLAQCLLEGGAEAVHADVALCGRMTGEKVPIDSRHDGEMVVDDGEEEGLME